MESQIQQAIKVITEFQNKHGKPITEYEVTQEQYEQLRKEVSQLNTYSNLDMPLGNTIMGIKIKVVPSELDQLRQQVAEQQKTIEARDKLIVLGQSERQKHYNKSAEQAELIEKLVAALRKEAGIYIENDPEDGPPEDIQDALTAYEQYLKEKK